MIVDKVLNKIQCRSFLSIKRLLVVMLVCGSISLAEAQQITSPNKNFSLTFSLKENGVPFYELTFKNKPVIKSSKLGLATRQGGSFLDGFTVTDVKTTSIDESWDPVLGEQKTIRNHYHELLVTLTQQAQQGRFMRIRFRLFDDGLGFRYEFPMQKGLSYFIVKDEVTEFNLAGNHKIFWIPGDYDTNEYPYTTSTIAEIPSLQKKATVPITAQQPIKAPSVQTPCMMKSADGLYINIHEAVLINYPAMDLEVDAATLKMKTHLVPDAVGNLAYMQTNAQTPWRTIVVSDKATDILASRLILNLNEPTKYKDVSWIKPVKYMGVWWEYFVAGKSNWAYSTVNNVKLTDNFAAFPPSGHHGATNENVKKYIDFASANGFDAVLVEGWNVGWEDWIGNWKEEVFDFVTPYPDFDVKMLREYAASKGIKIIMHHETSAAATNYERRLDRAFQFMVDNGYNAVKTGYVGDIIPRGEHHDGQWMVNHYIHVADRAADYKIMVNSHEAVRPTGLNRTYPNWIAQESARGTEFEAMAGLAPEHGTILPFTRLMGGPMDYTPGIFQTDLSYYGTGSKQRVNTTLVKQLAYYVTMYSPLQMAADMPENYARFPDAFQFIKDVAVDWDDTYVLEAEPGDYITIARKAKGKQEWYVGGITDENRRTATISFSFLPKGKSYIATIYADGTDASYDKKPQSYTIRKVLVSSSSVLKQVLASSGGVAVSIKEGTSGEIKGLKKL
ncbi:glycoside hydrolase family 97 protein [Xanthocytophaga agilis]|uniref:Glycoside hydrolase family 97 protein n=1 Tax=Xanthocytophaga agilis TaxID=3048010 RepID=A0AAE3UIY8_9BACT|nr:glycoside hydrolase family 97 protein [Xanthocytophaga agilis]MDJ1504363.1 glycoside hydrolase family 97 protein [Xanthocytophaga agilis]